MWRGGAEQWRHGFTDCDWPGGLWLDLLLGSGWPSAGPVAPPSQPSPRARKGHDGRHLHCHCTHQTSLISLVDPRLAGLAHARVAVRFVVVVAAAAAAFASSSCLRLRRRHLSLLIFTRPASHIPFSRWPLDRLAHRPLTSSSCPCCIYCLLIILLIVARCPPRRLSSTTTPTVSAAPAPFFASHSGFLPLYFFTAFGPSIRIRH